MDWVSHQGSLLQWLTDLNLPDSPFVSGFAYYSNNSPAVLLPTSWNPASFVRCAFSLCS